MTTTINGQSKTHSMQKNTAEKANISGRGQSVTQPEVSKVDPKLSEKSRDVFREANTQLSDKRSLAEIGSENATGSLRLGIKGGVGTVLAAVGLASLTKNASGAVLPSADMGKPQVNWSNLPGIQKHQVSSAASLETTTTSFSALSATPSDPPTKTEIAEAQSDAVIAFTDIHDGLVAANEASVQAESARESADPSGILAVSAQAAKALQKGLNSLLNQAVSGQILKAFSDQINAALPVGAPEADALSTTIHQGAETTQGGIIGKNVNFDVSIRFPEHFGLAATADSEASQRFDKAREALKSELKEAKNQNNAAEISRISDELQALDVQRKTELSLGDRKVSGIMSFNRAMVTWKTGQDDFGQVTFKPSLRIDVYNPLTLQARDQEVGERVANVGLQSTLDIPFKRDASGALSPDGDITESIYVGAEGLITSSFKNMPGFIVQQGQRALTALQEARQDQPVQENVTRPPSVAQGVQEVDSDTSSGDPDSFSMSSLSEQHASLPDEEGQPAAENSDASMSGDGQSLTGFMETAQKYISNAGRYQTEWGAGGGLSGTVNISGILRDNGPGAAAGYVTARAIASSIPKALSPLVIRKHIENNIPTGPGVVNTADHLREAAETLKEDKLLHVASQAVVDTATLGIAHQLNALDSVSVGLYGYGYTAASGHYHADEITHADRQPVGEVDGIFSEREPSDDLREIEKLDRVRARLNLGVSAGINLYEKSKVEL